MIVHEIHDLSNDFITEILKSEFSKITDDKIIKNYHPDYSDEHSNIFYVLKHGRYKKDQGKYYVVEDQGQYVCSAGWNEYTEDTSIAFALTRMYIAPKYRGKYLVEKFILNKSLEETKKYKKIWLTVNEHNSTIYSWFVRAHEGKSTALFNNWPDTYKLFQPIGKKLIYNTDQYVMELRREINMTKDQKILLLVEGIKHISAGSADKIDLNSINGETLMSELKLDSLDIVELMMFYEDKLGQTIPDPKKEIKTVNDLLELLPENV